MSPADGEGPVVGLVDSLLVLVVLGQDGAGLARVCTSPLASR